MSMINREALIRDAEREGKLRKDKWDTEAVVNFIKGAMFVRCDCFGKWTPYDKIKPPKDKEVVVWFEYFRFGDYNCKFQAYGIYDEAHPEFINSQCGWLDLRIIAWMPLPEPPKEVN